MQQTLTDATAIFSADDRFGEIIPPQPGMTISPDGRTGILIAGADGTTDALCFVAGLLTLNGSLGTMPVSLVMSLRAAEPLFTVSLAACAGTEGLSRRVVLSVLPIVLGAGLSATESAEATLHGVSLVAACNACWAGRSVCAKVLQERHPELDDLSLFLHVAAIGAVAQLVVCACVAPARPQSGAAPSPKSKSASSSASHT